MSLTSHPRMGSHRQPKHKTKLYVSHWRTAHLFHFAFVKQVGTCCSCEEFGDLLLSPFMKQAGSWCSCEEFGDPLPSVLHTNRVPDVRTARSPQAPASKVIEGVVWAMATEMGRVRCLCVGVLLLLVSAPSAAAGGGRDVEEARLHQLNGTIGEMHEAEEWSLGSEIGRRILQSIQTSISYGALQKDKVPLQTPQPGNPYTRGCEARYYCKS